MASYTIKYLGKSKIYKHTYKELRSNGELGWFGNVWSQKKSGFDNERDCALWVDMQLIRKGKPPVNILKPK